MKYQEILDKLEEMHDESAKEFIGSNEADLDFKENVARWIEGLVKESDSLPCVRLSLPDDALHFAEWMDIVCIRDGRFEWKYRADNYTKKHTTKEMFDEWQRLLTNEA